MKADMYLFICFRIGKAVHRHIKLAEELRLSCFSLLIISRHSANLRRHESHIKTTCYCHWERMRPLHCVVGCEYLWARRAWSQHTWQHPRDPNKNGKTVVNLNVKVFWVFFTCIWSCKNCTRLHVKMPQNTFTLKFKANWPCTGG